MSIDCKNCSSLYSTEPTAYNRRCLLAWLTEWSLRSRLEGFQTRSLESLRWSVYESHRQQYLQLILIICHYIRQNKSVSALQRVQRRSWVKDLWWLYRTPPWQTRSNIALLAASSVHQSTVPRRSNGPEQLESVWGTIIGNRLTDIIILKQRV